MAMIAVAEMRPSLNETVPGGAALLVNRTGHTMTALPTLRDQVGIRREWIDYRVRYILPGLMQQYGVNFWVLSQREYHEDVAWRSVADPLSLNARRRTVIVYSYDGTDVTAHSFVSFESSIWAELAAQLELGVAGGKIALNVDTEFAFSDGLAAGELEALSQGIGPALMARVVRAPLLAMDFIAVRAPTMLPYYVVLMQQAHAIIREAFSTRVINVGTTTAAAVQWWMREQTITRRLAPGFHPSFSIQRQGVPGDLDGDTVIVPGDLLWCDYGHIGMDLWTDTQHMGYVLKPGETQVPAGLAAGLSLSNKAQDAVLKHLTPGVTGNAVLAAVVADMEADGIDSIIYCHPIGDHMHGAGATIGLFDSRNRPVPTKGDVKVVASSWYSVELQVRHRVPEWDGQLVQFRQEEDAGIDAAGAATWILRRQTELYAIG